MSENRTAPEGIYFYRIRVGNEVVTTRVVRVE